jgi:hypothetical protein
MFEIRLQKDVKGKGVGWDWDMLPFTIKEGCTTYIGSAPASGKTELWFEFLINLSCFTWLAPRSIQPRNWQRCGNIRRTMLQVYR